MTSARSTVDSQPQVVETIAGVRAATAAAQRAGQRIGFVPTMGALHVGHASLFDAARRDCDLVVASIFVNPLQFGPNEDFNRYPRPREADVALCAAHGVDLVFYPSVEEMYPTGFATSVDVGGVSESLEGAHRPGHFRGVATVVLKLFLIVGADAAYFGAKDFQQQSLIRKMCQDLAMPIEIVVCPTVREPDGLALSSRNRYLGTEERVTALLLSKALHRAKERLLAGETDVQQVRAEMWATLQAGREVVVDYATVADPATLEELSLPRSQMVAVIAARVGATRLIDNMEITLSDTKKS